MDGAIRLLPAPLERPPAMATHAHTGEEELVEMKASEPLVALAFKVQLWEGRRHVFARVYRGTLSAGDKVRLAGTDTTERAARIFDVDGGGKKRIDTARAGQIILLAGLKHATTGDTLCDPAHPVLLERIESRSPVLGLAVEPESSKDEEKLLEVVGKICEEDPTLVFSEDEETGQRILSGMGELHLMIVFERIQREFGVKVRAGKPKVMTRETVLGTGKADTLIDRTIRTGEDQTTHLKARVVASARALPRDTGLTVSADSPRVMPEGAHLTRLQAEAVAAGAQDALSGGPLEGAPLQDVAIEVHQVELYADASSAQALRIAASQAVREAIIEAGGALLRPLMRIEVVVPNEAMGGVLGDLQSRQAMISGTEQDTGTATIHGECPLQALLGYTTDLRSMTQGRGQFTMEFARFDVS
jgi:elongation factor G